MWLFIFSMIYMDNRFNRLENINRMTLEELKKEQEKIKK
jgi:hypothetical protein